MMMLSFMSIKTRLPDLKQQQQQRQFTVQPTGCVAWELYVGLGSRDESLGLRIQYLGVTILFGPRGIIHSIAPGGICRLSNSLLDCI